MAFVTRPTWAAQSSINCLWLALQMLVSFAKLLNKPWIRAQESRCALTNSPRPQNPSAILSEFHPYHPHPGHCFCFCLGLFQPSSSSQCRFCSVPYKERLRYFWSKDSTHRSQKYRHTAAKRLDTQTTKLLVSPTLTPDDLAD